MEGVRTVSRGQLWAPEHELFQIVSGSGGRCVTPPQPEDGQGVDRGRKERNMTDVPHAFENDIIIEQDVENGEVIYSAYADGDLIKRYPPCQARNAMVARQLATGALSTLTLNSDLLDVAAWFAETHPALPGHFSLQRYRFQKWRKVFSHIIVFSTPAVREQFEAIVEEAFCALGWQINPHGGSSADWLETPILTDISAHRRLSALGRVERALQAYRRSEE
jgi:hypothetical protein